MKTLIITFLTALIMFSSCSDNKQTLENKSETIQKTESNKIKNMNFYSKLTETIDKILTQNIQDDHRESLDKIAAYIREKQEKKEKCEIIFICTHNSRRSHLAQIWAQTAAENFELKNIVTYSGGTEATAFNPRAIASLERAGFNIENPGGDNPHYLVKFSEKGKAMECFSKKYSDVFNPQKGFLAVMVCDNADEACPVVAGAEARISLPFIDPKKSDGTAEEAATYDARSMQIAVEMYYIMAKAKL
jgi:arsenate reductase